MRASLAEALLARRLVAVLRAPDPVRALRAVEALVAGGVHGIEVTFSTPGAPQVIAEVARRYGEQVLLGAGTVRTPEQAAAAADAGAQFIVSPGTDDTLALAMRATGVPMMLGALTPSEVMRAAGLGAGAIKLFPASLGGPAYLRALREPFPDVPFVPTGGVSADNVREWLDAGAIAVGAGGQLCSAGDLAAGRFDAIERRACRFSEAVSEWQQT